MPERYEISYPKIKQVLSALAIFGFCNTWGRTVADGSLARLLTAMHGGEPYVLPGTHELLVTSITGIRWPLDYILDVLIVFFWEAVDGSHPTTSAIGIYFLGQYYSILMTIYIDSNRPGNAGQRKLSPVAWLLAFQMLAAATVGPLYAIVYLSVSPLASELSLPQLAAESLGPTASTYILPLSLTLGYIAPAIAMALPSPSCVSNHSQQMAVAMWNVFPLIIWFVHQALGSIARVQDGKMERRASSGSYLNAVRFACIFSLVISTVTHLAIVSLSLSTAILPFLFRPSYARALGPSALLVPPVAFTTVSSLGEGVRSFFLWDQIFAYSTMLGLAYVQLQRILRASRVRTLAFSDVGLVVLGILVIGPGSVVVILNWIGDEELFGQNHVDKSSAHNTTVGEVKASS